MKEDLELLHASLTRVLLSIEAVKKVAAKFEEDTDIGKLAETIIARLNGNAEDISSLIALRVREGGDYE